MSQQFGPGFIPEFQPPITHAGYGGELQSYGQPVHPQPGYAQPEYAQPNYPQPGYPQPGYLPGNYGSMAAAGAPRSPQRPAVVGLAATLAAAASLQWVAVLSFTWLVATSAIGQLGTSGMDGGFYHLLNRISFRLLDGLAWPLYLFPLAAFVLSFLLLTGHTWTRWAFTATGAAAILWSAWWLRNDLLLWLIPAGYIGIATLVLWTADATRWFQWRTRSDAAAQQG